MLRDRLLNAATVLMVACALTVTGITVRREMFGQPQSANRSSKPTIERQWQEYFTAGRLVGRADSGVTILEFADFECPACRQFGRYVDSVNALGIPVRVLYRHYPLPTHRFALPAATASECAAEEGRFEEMHAVLFAHSDSFGITPWWGLARKAGLQDSAKFARCMGSAGPLERLTRDTTAGNQLGVRGTPTLLIDSLRFDGVPPFDSLRAHVMRARQTTSARRK
jgi:protein-disulfide isomerase